MIGALILFPANCKQDPELIGMFPPVPDGSRKHRAQSLLDLPCHPKVLDFAIVDAIAVANTAADVRAG